MQLNAGVDGCGIERRAFVAGMASVVAGAALATSGTKAYASEASSGSVTYPDTIAWDGTYDVIVIGFGMAGGTAARFAADAGAKVLLVDSAPVGEEGGNSRYCAQLIASADDADAMLTYYKNLAWKFDMDEDVLKVYTQGEADMKDYISTYLGVEAVGWKNNDTAPEYLAKALKAAIPEYPELEGSDTFDFLTVHEGIFDGKLWRTVRQLVADRTDNISVWLESPAKHLIQDPTSGAIVGVVINHDGSDVSIRANNGVVMTSGGFENNPQMVQDYLGVPKLSPLGSMHNQGDGVSMALEVGADLWHMHNYESLGMLGGNALHVEDTNQARLTYWTSIADGSIIVVGDDGGRYMKEDDTERHGHFYSNGVYRIPTVQAAPWLVFDQTKYDWFDQNFDTLPNKEFMSGVVESDTVAGLAEQIGVDADILQKSIDDFGFFAEQGCDYAHSRAAETISAFDDGPYYAAALHPVVLNTQGGPRRSANAEILGTDGNPIPHLYSAGEFGGVTAFQYQGGGNMAECLIFGKIAGENAAVAKDDLPAIEGAVAVESKDTYGIGKGDYDFSSETVSVDLGQNEYLGTSTEGMGGVLEVKVTIEGGKATAIEVVREKETPMYGGAALDTLCQEVLDSGSAEIDTVGGATCTSNAFIEAVTDAFSQVK